MEHSGTYILASDLGGSGTKTMLYDLSGEIVSLAFRESLIKHKQKGSVSQEPEEMFTSVIEGMKECLETSKIDPKDVAAIVLDGQQSGMLWIDKDYKAISPYDSWLDTRYGSYIKEMRDCCGERILEKTGTDRGFVHGPKILWWKNNYPDIYKNAHKMVIPASYVGGLLADLNADDAYFEDTSIGFSGICDLYDSTWDKEICEAVGIALEKLPQIVESTKIIGYLCKRYADELGLLQGVPIVSGGGDFPVSMLGAGVCEAGQAADLTGTASILFVCEDFWKPDPTGKTRTLKSPIPGLWLTYEFVSGGGCIRWFLNEFLQNEKKSVDNIYRYLGDKIEDIPIGCDGLGFYPYIGGTQAHPEYGGSWVGIQWDHRKEHFYRSILESVAYSYRYILESIKTNLNIDNIEEIRVFGGGSGDEIWNQMKVDVLKTPYLLLEQQECSLLGSAIIAGYAIGAYDDMIEISKNINRVVGKVHPDRANTEKYSEKYDLWHGNLAGSESSFLKGI
ncbi:MAG: FGGY family carbohydrate kinase [Saccharofermentanales bacterium]